jgi:hypothetical protein
VVGYSQLAGTILVDLQLAWSVLSFKFLVPAHGFPLLLGEGSLLVIDTARADGRLVFNSKTGLGSRNILIVLKAIL